MFENITMQKLLDLEVEVEGGSGGASSATTFVGSSNVDNVDKSTESYRMAL